MKKLLLVVLMGLSTAAFAQVEKGDFNTTFNALYLKGDGFAFGVAAAKIGYFFTQNLEIGITPQVSISDVGGEKETSPGYGAYTTYNFLTSSGKLLPYLGASVDIISSGGQEFTAYGAYGGSKYFLTESLNIDAGLKFLFSEGESIMLTTVGVGFIIGKTK